MTGEAFEVAFEKTFFVQGGPYENARRLLEFRVNEAIARKYRLNLSMEAAMGGSPILLDFFERVFCGGPEQIDFYEWIEIGTNKAAVTEFHAPFRKAMAHMTEKMRKAAELREHGFAALFSRPFPGETPEDDDAGE